MKEKWTGTLIGYMHNNDVSQQDLADELGFSRGYVCMILNGTRRPPDAKERLMEAYNNILAKRASSASSTKE